MSLKLREITFCQWQIIDGGEKIENRIGRQK